MKRITFLLFFLTVSFGFSQVVLEDFESGITAGDEWFGDSGDGSNPNPPTVAVETDHGDGARGNAGKMIINDAGAPWQNAQLFMQSNYIDLRTANKTISIDVFSTPATDILAKVVDPVGGGGEIATDASHPGGGWATLNFNFNVPKDGTAVQDLQYGRILFFPDWDSSANAGAGGWASPNQMVAVTTTYYDNITGLAGDAVVFAKEIIEDFESGISAGTEWVGDSGDGSNPNPPTVAVETDHGDGTRGNAGKMIINNAGAPWQNAQLFVQTNFIDLTKPDKTITVDVFSTPATDILAKVVDPVGGGGEIATDASHPGGGWATLEFNFNVPKDGTSVQDLEYGRILFFPDWDSSANAGAGGWASPNQMVTVTTTYYDNITAIAGGPVITPCTNGVQDPGETGVDCGGSCPNACPIVPLTSAPDPTILEDNVLSIYSDTYTVNTVSGFTFNVFSDGESTYSQVDIESDGNMSGLLEMTGSNPFHGSQWDVVDATPYTHVSLDYWTADSKLIEFFLIDQSLSSDPGAVCCGNPNEPRYTIAEGGGDENIVAEAWTTVSIPLQHFIDYVQDPGNGNTGTFDGADIFQYKVVGNGTVYIDNIYFYNEPTASAEDFNTLSVELFPNPTSSIWTVKTPSNTIKSVEVFNMLGKSVLTIQSNSNEVNIDGSSLSSGIYIAKINSEDKSQTVKLVKR